MATALLVTAGYSLWLLPSSGTGLPSWLRPALAALALAAECGLAAVAWRPGRGPFVFLKPLG